MGDVAMAVLVEEGRAVGPLDPAQAGRGRWLTATRSSIQP